MAEEPIGEQYWRCNSSGPDDPSAVEEAESVLDSPGAGDGIAATTKDQGILLPRPVC